MLAPARARAPPEPPSPRDGRDHGRAQRQAALGGAGDGLALATLLRAYARIGAGGVDKSQHRQVEPLRHVHQAHRLAIALGPRHAEIMLQPGLGIAALLMAHDHHAPAAKTAEAADDGLVVAVDAVAAQFDEVLDQLTQVVGEVRPLGMARDLGLLPGVEPGIDVAAEAVGAGRAGRRSRPRRRLAPHSRTAWTVRPSLASISATGRSKSR